MKILDASSHGPCNANMWWPVEVLGATDALTFPTEWMHSLVGKEILHMRKSIKMHLCKSSVLREMALKY